MILYYSSKFDFLHKNTRHIADILKQQKMDFLAEETDSSEITSWINSLEEMQKVLGSNRIPDSAGIALEFSPPGSTNRIDFMITGKSISGERVAVLIELKQWTSVIVTRLDGQVKTEFYDKAASKMKLQIVPHPSCQVLKYADYMAGHLSVIQNGKVEIHQCCYLHNCQDGKVINDSVYAKYTKQAPAFCKGEGDILLDYIAKYIYEGENDDCSTIDLIQNSPYQVSEPISFSMESFARNYDSGFTSEQKNRYEQIKGMVDYAIQSKEKWAIAIPGGPGTGKTYLALKLVFELSSHARAKRQPLLFRYITKNAQPRNVLHYSINQTNLPDDVKNGLCSVINAPNIIHTTHLNGAFVDEAHRLNIADYQLKNIIKNSDLSVFFVDDKQWINIHENGRIKDIESEARAHNRKFHLMKPLVDQIRCNGTGRYIKWIDSLLQYPDAMADLILDKQDEYDFEVLDSPVELMQRIQGYDRPEEHKISRVVAGFTREWDSQNGKDVYDWDLTNEGFPEFKYKWNIDTREEPYSISPGTVNQIGCIHTCQGSEFEYAGVIIGKDLAYRNGNVIVQPQFRAKKDHTLEDRQKKEIETLSYEDQIAVEQIIKNTYRVLLTRGKRGTLVYVEDEALRNYIKCRYHK